ncbi:MAG: glycosyltransferase family 39 protein, partial [Anaerolineaceae bacterium]|nr:glycosyltransferase family 39 protein [Anaerolineaceae bacterium]
MNNQIKRLFGPLLGFAALFGMALVYYATTAGPGVGGDATIYLTSAKNLILGKGLGWMDADGSFRLLPYTPPFYPLLLSLVGLFGDMAAGARFLNLILFGSTVIFTGLSFSRFTGQPWFGAILGGLLAASPVLLGVQVWAMSEPLFLFLGFSGLLVLLNYLDSGRRRDLLASALLCGLAFLTRYMGAAFIATAGLALFLFGRGEDRRFKLSIGRRELVEAVPFGVVSILPILAWFIVDLSITGTLGSRSGQPAAAYWQRFLEMGPA